MEQAKELGKEEEERRKERNYVYTITSHKKKKILYIKMNCFLESKANFAE